nr:hypothetical protein [Tanacetum cinerariifolium]
MAFLVTADVPEIYMQEFWATATVHHHSIHFKINNKKHIVNLEYFREMLYICLRIPNQTFDELPFEEEILAFLRYLGHNGEIKKITDGMYHKKNVDFAYLLWEDFVYQVEHKDAKKSNEMYFPRDDQMFTMIKLVLRHQNTQQFGAMLHVELTNEDIRNSAAYKEYYAIASRAAPPKTKASVRKMQSSFDTIMPPSTASGTRISTSAKGKQPAKSSKTKGLSVLSEVALTEAEQMKLATKISLQQTHISQASGFGADEGTDIIPGVPDVLTYESDEEISGKSSDEDDDDDVDDQSDDDNQEDEDEQDDDDQDNNDDQDSDNDVKNSDDESNDDDSHGMNVGGDEGPDAEDDDEELYGDVNINLEGRDVQMTDVHTTQVLEDTHVTLTSVNPNGQQQSSSVSSQFFTSIFNPSPNTCIDSLFESTPQMNVPVMTTVEPLLLTATTLPPPSIPTISQVQQAPAPSPTTAPSTFLQDLLNFSSLFGYIDHWMNEAVKVAVELQFDRLRDEAQAKNEDFLNKPDENIQRSKSSKKSIHQSDEQRNLYKALVNAYECDKIILDTYEDTVTLKRRCDDEDKDEETSAGSDQGSKRRQAGKEPESTSAPKEKASKTSSKSIEGSKSYQNTKSESALAEEPMQTTQDLKEPSHQEFKTCVADDQPVAEASQHPKCDLAKQADSRTSFNELMDTHMDFSTFLMNQLKVDTLTPELLAGPTYELMKGSCKSLVELEFFLKEIVEWHNCKHLDWITMHRDDDKLYKFKEGDLKRLRIQDIKDMLLLMVQGKLTDLTIEERFAFNISLRMFTRSIVIKRRVKDLLLGVESYQKKINLTKPDTLMRIDELHKFSDGMLNDVRTALDDRLKGIRMKYLPYTIWTRSDKKRAAAMIQAIDKQLKTRRIMRSLEKFVGGRLYKGDFRMLQRII